MQARDAGGWDRAVAVDLVRKGRFWKYFESKANEFLEELLDYGERSIGVRHRKIRDLSSLPAGCSLYRTPSSKSILLRVTSLNCKPDPVTPH